MPLDRFVIAVHGQAPPSAWISLAALLLMCVLCSAARQVIYCANRWTGAECMVLLGGNGWFIFEIAGIVLTSIVNPYLLSSISLPQNPKMLIFYMKCDFFWIAIGYRLNILVQWLSQ